MYKKLNKELLIDLVVFVKTIDNASYSIINNCVYVIFRFYFDEILSIFLFKISTKCECQWIKG